MLWSGLQNGRAALSRQLAGGALRGCAWRHSDKPHAHCQREKSCGPRAIIHERLVREACTRLQQLDLPVEQIGYGLGFRDPAYFNRFFRKYRGASPGNYRRQIRLEHARSSPSYAAWP